MFDSIKCLFGKHLWANYKYDQKITDKGGLCFNCGKMSWEVLGKLMKVKGF